MDQANVAQIPTDESGSCSRIVHVPDLKRRARFLSSDDSQLPDPHPWGARVLKGEQYHVTGLQLLSGGLS